jgi:hypothetical protein
MKQSKYGAEIRLCFYASTLDVRFECRDDCEFFRSEVMPPDENSSCVFRTDDDECQCRKAREATFDKMIRALRRKIKSDEEGY